MTTSLNRILLLVGAFVPSAHAHEGHGMPGSHWHATDAVGFGLLLLLVGGVMWWRGRR